MASNIIHPLNQINMSYTGGGGRVKPLTNAKFYFGTYDGDPKIDTIIVQSKDEAGTVETQTQPISTNMSGHFVDKNGKLIELFSDQIGYSVLAEDANGQPAYGPERVGDQGNVTDAVAGLTNLQAASVADMVLGRTIDGTVIVSTKQSWNVIEREPNIGSADWDTALTSSVTPNGSDIIQSTSNPTVSFMLRPAHIDGDLIRSNMYGIPNGADQANLETFRANFTQRKNPAAVFPGFIGINNPDCGSVLDLANFGGQDIPGFNPIGFVFHHYSDNRMIQMDNVGEANELLYLKNANNPTRRPDKASDFIGSAKFISCNRQESDGGGGVTGTLEGFYISKDFELVWPMKATGINTVRLLNNVAAASGLWTHEFKNTNEQQYLFRIDNGGTNHLSVEYFAAATNTKVKAAKSLQLEAVDGVLYLKSSTVINSTVPHKMKEYARSQLPALTASERGCFAYLLDGPDNYPIYFNGSGWFKISDNSPA